MKVTLHYSNSASIPLGVPYMNSKPVYSITKEMDVPEEDVDKVSVKELTRMKVIVDEKLDRDIKFRRDIMVKCTCVPSYDYDKKEYVHSEYCSLTQKEFKNAS